MRLLVIAVLWVLSAGAWAGQLVDIYRAEQLVASQSAAERDQAARRALGNIVVRVSGDQTAREHPEIKAALGRAQDYVYEFNYASTSEMLEREGRELPATKLVLKFSPSATKGLLRSAGLPLWPANRPSLLVWLVKDDAQGPQQVTEEPVRQALREQVEQRGLPLILPLHDLEDRLALSARQLWRMDQAAIQKASERYDADAILVGRYSPTSTGIWRSNWQLYHSQGSPTFYLEGISANELIDSALNRVADHFADLYAITPGAGGPDVAVLQLVNIDSFGDFKQAQRYLDGLAMIRRSELVSVDAQGLVLRLYMEGDLERLLSTLSLEKKMRPSVQSIHVSISENPFLPRATVANPLRYTWQP